MTAVRDVWVCPLQKRGNSIKKHSHTHVATFIFATTVNVNSNNTHCDDERRCLSGSKLIVPLVLRWSVWTNQCLALLISIFSLLLLDIRVKVRSGSSPKAFLSLPRPLTVSALVLPTTIIA